MKIAYLANIRFPSERAHSTQIAHMCQAFVEVGHEVDLYLNKRTVVDADVISDYFGFKIGFKTFNIPPKFFYPKYKIFFYISELIFSVFFLLGTKRKDYDVIFSRNEWIVFILSFFVTDFKLVWESHEAKLNFPARKILNKENIKIVTISEGIFEDYLKYGLDKSRMVIAHDGIDESFFGTLETRENVRHTLNIPIHDKVAMYIGGLDGWKGVETFFQSSELCSNFLFYVIGGRADQIEKYKKQYTKVNFLGSRPYSELRFNQQAADVLVIPNSGVGDLSAKYTSPLKLFAHMTSGIPILVSDIQSMRNVIDENDVTFFRPDDAQSLVDGLNEIYMNFNDKIEIAKKLIVKSRTYTWKNRAIIITKFINNTEI